MSHVYEIRDYSASKTCRDVKQLMQLKKKKTISHKFYKKKYDVKSYANHSMMSQLIYFKGKAVAHVGAFPMTSIIDGETHKVLQIGDIITHPDFLGKGLFKMLMNSIVEKAKKHGISFLFVVPNKNAFPIFLKKFNWNYHNENSILSVKIKTFPINKFFNKINAPKLYSLIFETLNSKRKVDRNKIQFTNSLIKDGYSGILRNSNFYNYKTYSKNYMYQFKNGIVWFKIDDGFIIGDIKLNLNSNIESLIDEFINFAKINGIHKIKLYTTKFGSLYKYVKELNPIESKGLTVMTYSIDKNISISNWNTNMADYNTF